MKRLLTLSLAAALVAATGVSMVRAEDASSATKPADKAAPAKPAAPVIPGVVTQTDRFSYCVGITMGMKFKEGGIDVNAAALAQGIKDYLANKPGMTQEQMAEVMQVFQQEMMAKVKVAAEKGKTDGVAFLEKNKKADGVKTTASGLQYRVVKEGSGKSPAKTDTVVVKYRGTLTDGTEFDASEKHGGTAEFPVDQVIPGWTEGLQLMKLGAKYQFFIPSELAYGERGQEGIPPNSVLVFDVELVDIKAPGK